MTCRAMPSAHAAATAASMFSKCWSDRASAMNGIADERQERGFFARRGQDQFVAADKHGPPAPRPMLRDHRQSGLDGKEDHLAIAQRCHLGHQRIRGMQNRHAIGQHHVHLGAQHLENLLGLSRCSSARNAWRARSGSPRRLGSGHRPGLGPRSHPRHFPTPRPPPSGSSAPAWPDCQLPQSPVSTCRRSRNNPSPQAKPVDLPPSRRNSATKCATSVVPPEPVMPTTGMRPLSPLGNK